VGWGGVERWWEWYYEGGVRGSTRQRTSNKKIGKKKEGWASTGFIVGFEKVFFGRIGKKGG